MDIDCLETHWTSSELDLLADADTNSHPDWLLSIHFEDDALFEGA